MIRKARLLDVDEEESLRNAAHAECRSEAAIVSVQELFGLDEADEGDVP